MTAASKGARGLLSPANEVEREAYPLKAASISRRSRPDSMDRPLSCQPFALARRPKAPSNSAVIKPAHSATVH